MGALENSTSNNHSSVGSSSDKCAFSNSGNSAANVTKKDIQEFSHVLSNPCETVFSSESKMFTPQVSVTCQHECSQDGQPQNVPQVITNSVVAGSSPNENENAHSPNVPMFSPKSEVIYEKSSGENLSQEVDSRKEIKKEQLAPESKNEENLRVNIVGPKDNVFSECRGLSFASSPESRAYVTDVSDMVSLPATSSKINSIHPFENDNFNVSVTIKGNSYRALLDTGAAVTAISSQVWDKYLSHKNCCLDSSSNSSVTTVNGSPLSVLGKVWLNFVIKSDVFPFEAYVIKDLTHDVVLGRDFLQKYCSRIDFMENIIEFSQPEDPLPFADSFGDDLAAEDFDNCILSVHADNSFTIPAQSEVVVVGRLSSMPKVVTDTSASEIYGLVTPKSDLPHRYSVFGASELVKVSSDATIPVRMVNPSAQPVKIFRRTKLADFERVDNDLATFEIGKNSPSSDGQHYSSDDRQQPKDYSEFPDLSNSVLNDDEKVKFKNLFNKYRNVFAFPGDQLGRTSLVQHVIDTGDATPIKQRPYRVSPDVKREIDRQVGEMLEKGIIQESVSPWSSPVVLVKKKDGSYRFCVDFRKINKVTKVDSFPMPLVADALDSLAGASVFSTLDLKSGFLADTNATGFATKDSLCYTQWPLRISDNAVWISELRSQFSKTYGSYFERFRIPFCFDLHR